MKKTQFFKYYIMLIATIILLFMPVTVKAYSGEIDPKDYIYLPYIINHETGGTITIFSSAGTGYSLYYQYEFITSTKKSQIENAMKEYNNYVSTVEAEREAAYDEYEKLNEDSSATEEQIEEAYENYKNIVESTKQSLENKLASVYELYPSYTQANWKETIDNKVLVDVSEYSGEIYYILWVKLTNSEGTYYDVGLYTSEGTKKITLGLNKTTAEIEVGDTLQLSATTNSNETVMWTSDKENIATVNSSGVVTGVAEGVATITAEVEGEKAYCTVTVKAKTGGTENDEGNTEEDNQDGLTWTDFSNAKVKLDREKYYSGYFVIINNVNLLGTSEDIKTRYQVYVSTDPNDNLKEESWCSANSVQSKLYNNTNEIAVPISAKLYEKAGEQLYVWVRERQHANGKTNYRLVLEAVPVNRLSQNPLGARFSAYFLSTGMNLWLNEYHFDIKTVKYKIGRITDTTILNAIKNGETGCLDKLLTYAKNANNGYSGACQLLETESSILNKLNLVDDAYYYLYLELDTENGKYYPVEDVNIYQAQFIYKADGTYIAGLYNYLSDEFVWNLSDEQTPSTPKDDTVSSEKLPNTGKSIIVTITILSIVTVGVISYRKIKMLKGI